MRQGFCLSCGLTVTKGKVASEVMREDGLSRGKKREVLGANFEEAGSTKPKASFLQSWMFIQYTCSVISLDKLGWRSSVAPVFQASYIQWAIDSHVYL
jgi:hypothetical protein